MRAMLNEVIKGSLTHNDYLPLILFLSADAREGERRCNGHIDSPAVSLGDNFKFKFKF